MQAYRAALLQFNEQHQAVFDEDGLLVVGAEYSLDTGLVEFFDGVPAENAR